MKFVLLALAVVTMMPCVAVLHGQTAMPKAGPTGFEMLGPRGAVVWAEGAGTFQLWRVELGAVPKWKTLSAPALLQAFKAKSQDDEAEVTVTLQDGVLRLFWVEGRDCVERSEGYQCPFEVDQAESQDGGSSWDVFASKFEGNMSMSSVWQVVMTDGLHGWMLLTSDPGAGQLPEELATTRDGGRSWKKADAKGMPIGRNGPQLLIPRSPSEAWFAAIHYDEDQNPVLMSHSLDGGRTWHEDASFEREFSWCKNCTAVTLSATDNRFHASHACFEVALLASDAADKVTGAGQAVTGASQARYCLAPGARSWLAPVRLQVPKAPSAKMALQHVFLLPLFASRTLGFTVVDTDRPESSGHPESHPNGQGGGNSRSAVYQTNDGGRSWHTAPAPLQSGGNADATVSVAQVEGSGRDVLLLLQTAGEDTSYKLLYSADYGSSWVSLL